MGISNITATFPIREDIQKVRVQFINVIGDVIHRNKITQRQEKKRSKIGRNKEQVKGLSQKDGKGKEKMEI
jgi:hypothetical protein